MRRGRTWRAGKIDRRGSKCSFKATIYYPHGENTSFVDAPASDSEPIATNQNDEDRMHDNDERVPLAGLELDTRMIYGAIARVAR